MHDDDLLKYQIALTMVPKVGGITAKKLIAYCGGVEGVFLEKKKTLMKIPGIGANIAAAVSDREIFSRVEKEICSKQSFLL